MPGLPGEDGAPGQKVVYLTTCSIYMCLFANIKPVWVINCVCLCLQGEPGVVGIRGPEGTPGIGTQGEKVKKKEKK